MRIPNPRLLRIAGLTEGSIIERGDAERILTPLLQPVIELPSSIGARQSVGSTFKDSGIVTTGASIAGAVAGVNTDLVFLTKGCWRIRIFFDGQFQGTSSLTTSAISILDPNLVSAPLLQFAHFNPTSYFPEADFVVMFQDDNWKFAMNVGTTVALDLLRLSVSIVVNKLL
jgi:hypothetical protein